MSRTFGPFGSVTAGILRVKSTTSAVVAVGATGDVLTLTPPAGKIGLLRMLKSVSVEADMTLTVDGTVIQSSKSLASSPSSGSGGVTGFFVTMLSAAAGTSGGAQYVSDNTYVGLYFNSELVLAKDTGTTASEIKYSYDVMESI